MKKIVVVIQNKRGFFLSYFDTKPHYVDRITSAKAFHSVAHAERFIELHNLKEHDVYDYS